MSRQNVVCASCGKSIPLDAADVVGSGTGYRCEACATRLEVDAHLRAAAANDRANGSSHWARDMAPIGPSAQQVAAEVAEIRAHVPTAEDAMIPTSSEIDPVIQADEETLVGTALGKRREPLPPTVSSSSPSTGLPHASSRYFCIVCFRAASNTPRDCPRDHVPLSDLTNDEAVDDLRACVRRLANRREALRVMLIAFFSLGASVVTCAAMGWDLGRQGPMAMIMAGYMLTTLLLSRVLVPPIRVANRVPELLAAIARRYGVVNADR
jgi:hypothetical protein